MNSKKKSWVMLQDINFQKDVKGRNAFTLWLSVSDLHVASLASSEIIIHWQCGTCTNLRRKKDGLSRTLQANHTSFFSFEEPLKRAGSSWISPKNNRIDLVYKESWAYSVWLTEGKPAKNLNDTNWLIFTWTIIKFAHWTTRSHLIYRKNADRPHRS